MDYNCYFDMSAIAVTGIILIAAFVSRWIPTNRNRCYKRLASGVFFTALFNFAGCLMEAGVFVRTCIPARYFADTFYHYFHLLTGMYFLLFSYALMDENVYKAARRKTVYYPMIITSSLLILNLFFPLLFYYSPEGSYRHGTLYALLYLIGMYYLGFIIVTVIQNRRVLERRIISSMLVYVLLCSAGIVIQSVIRGFYIGEFFNSLALILLYMTVDPADEIRDDRYGILTRQAYLRSVHGDDLRGEPSHSVFLRISDSQESFSESGHIRQELMKQIADYLKRFRHDVWICVWEENSFVLYMMQPDLEKEAQIMKEIDDRFRQPWNTEGDERILTASIWPIRCPEDVASVSEILKKASLLNDPLLFHRQGIIPYPEAGFDEIAWYRRMNESAQHALEKNLVQVRYEPVFNLRTNTVITARAVAYFPDIDGTYVPGSAFIDTAGGMEYLADLDEYVLNDAAKNQKLLTGGNPEMYVSTRLAYSEITSRNFEERLPRILKRYGTEYQNIMLRISEGAFSRLDEQALSRIKEMQMKGWKFGVDDFGIGQSFLSRLIDEDVKYLVMHKEVTAAVLESEEGRRLGKGIVNMVHGMRKQITMTGVNTEEEVKRADEIGVDNIVGPAVSCPMCPEEFCEWMKERGDFR
ncbi:MAG: EAL domain-containing protein [Solobacterium sp.]|nr:EAL domain-containing protein [Solobacterium sp.]